jgi:hypothetical protein
LLKKAPPGSIDMQTLVFGFAVGADDEELHFAHSALKRKKFCTC